VNPEYFSWGVGLPLTEITEDFIDSEDPPKQIVPECRKKATDSPRSLTAISLLSI
jgi:hypothetical protein